MHYYTFHIGDYSSHASHLNPVEDCAYRRLLDKYYLSELPIPLDLSAAARLIGMRDYEKEVEIVINEFFTRTEAGFINKRADKEIAHFKGKVDKASKAGKVSAERRSNGTSSGLQVDLKGNTLPIAPLLPPNTSVQQTFNVRSTDVQQTCNQPITKNQQPITKNQDKPKVKPAGAEAPDWLPASWQTYTQHRKESRKPLTATAQTAAINKLERWKAEGKDIAAIITQSVENGWSGLFEVKQGVGQGKPSFTPPKLSCCVCGGVLKGFVETQSGKMCGTCWDKR